MTNHATPLGTWVEEQSIVDAPSKLAGDQPHCWATALFVRLAASMLACDHAGTSHLLLGPPPDWLRPGAVNRLDGYRTSGGPLTLTLRVAPDSRSATLDLSPPREGRLQFHTRALAAAGFRLEGTADTPALIAVSSGNPLTLRFAR